MVRGQHGIGVRQVLSTQDSIGICKPHWAVGRGTLRYNITSETQCNLTDTFVGHPPTQIFEKPGISHNNPRRYG